MGKPLRFAPHGILGVIEQASYRLGGPRPQSRVNPNWDADEHNAPFLKAMKGVACVYFIQAGTRRGPIKIGRASNLAGRLSDIQTHNHEALYVLAAIPGGAAEEARMHEKFDRARIRGEWFTPSPELLSFISSCANGQPRTRRVS